MGLPASHRISVPRGTQEHRRESGPISCTGLSPSMVGLSSAIPLSAGFVTPWGPGRDPCRVLQPPYSNGCHLSRCTGLGYSPFARHYSGNDLFSSRYLDVSVPSVPFRPPMCSAGDTRVLPAWVSPFGNPRIHACRSSPRLIAASHVLLRRLAPRHPP